MQIYHLTELKNLARLSFTPSHGNILSSQLLAVIQACPNRAVLQVGNVMSEDFIYQTFKVLQETRDPLNPKTLLLLLARGQPDENVPYMGFDR